MLDFKFYEEENVLLRQMLKNRDIEVEAYKNNAEQATKMYDELVQRYAELNQKYDELVKETIERDMRELGK